MKSIISAFFYSDDNCIGYTINDINIYYDMTYINNDYLTNPIHNIIIDTINDNVLFYGVDYEYIK